MDVLNPNDPSVMPAPVGAPPTAFPRWGAAQEVGTESLDPVRAVLLPGRDESPAEYLARLKNLHARAGSLISKIEERRTNGLAAPSGARVAAVVAAPAPVAAPLVAPAGLPPAEDLLSWPVRDRRERVERRIGAANRRISAVDRRRRNPDTRALFEERRAGARDRRTGAGNRRRDIDRRRNVRSLPWEGGLRFDRTTLIWIVQVSAWIAIVVLALVYGIGTS